MQTTPPRCCLRAAAVLHLQGSKSEAEYYTQQAGDVAACHTIDILGHTVQICNLVA